MSFDEMDAAAEKAKIALEAAMNDDSENSIAVQFVGGWWKSHYGAAGHKRLAHVLLKAAGLE